MTRVAVLLLVAAALAACGGDPDAAGSSTSTSTSSPTSSVTSEAPASESSTTVPSDPDARVAQDGDTVAVHYRGTLDDGEEFDSSEGRDPLSFVVGSGQVISGFDDAVRGLAVGESRTVRIPPAEAYGEVDESLVFDVPIDQAPEGLSVGDQVTMANGAPAVIVAVTDETVTVDANHRLAGQALTFEIELVSIG